MTHATWIQKTLLAYQTAEQREKERLEMEKTRKFHEQLDWNSLLERSQRKKDCHQGKFGLGMVGADKPIICSMCFFETWPFSCKIVHCKLLKDIPATKIYSSVS